MMQEADNRQRIQFRSFHFYYPNTHLPTSAHSNQKTSGPTRKVYQAALGSAAQKIEPCILGKQHLANINIIFVGAHMTDLIVTPQNSAFTHDPSQIPSAV
jgi:hypothetical protein